MDVRVASGVDVALRAIQHLGNFQLRNELRSFQESRRYRLDFGVSRLREQQRYPADLQLRTRTHYEVGVARPRDQARPCLDVMGILQGGGGAINGNLVAAKLLRQCAPLRLASENFELRERRLRQQHRERQGSRYRQDESTQLDYCSVHCNSFFHISELVRAVRAKAHDVLQEYLVVGHTQLRFVARSEEHTSELQSLTNLV